MADDSGQQPQQQQQQQQQQRVSLLYLLRHGYDDLVNAIIRKRATSPLGSRARS